MSEFMVKDLTDILLQDIDAMMRELCAAAEERSGRAECTSQEILKRAIQKQQDAYVQLLERCRTRYPDYIFNKAHEFIGHAIATKAARLGYERSKEDRSETNIFDDPTDRVVYRRP